MVLQQQASKWLQVGFNLSPSEGILDEKKNLRNLPGLFYSILFRWSLWRALLEEWQSNLSQNLVSRVFLYFSIEYNQWGERIFSLLANFYQTQSFGAILCIFLPNTVNAMEERIFSLFFSMLLSNKINEGDEFVVSSAILIHSTWRWTNSGTPLTEKDGKNPLSSIWRLPLWSCRYRHWELCVWCGGLSLIFCPLR